MWCFSSFRIFKILFVRTLYFCDLYIFNFFALGLINYFLEKMEKFSQNENKQKNEIFDTIINEATIEKSKKQEFEENPI